jgi:hypothetical protein
VCSSEAASTLAYQIPKLIKFEDCMWGKNIYIIEYFKRFSIFLHKIELSIKQEKTTPEP